MEEDNNSVLGTKTQQIMHVTAPTSSSISLGVSGQVDISGAINVSKVAWRKGIQQWITAASAELKKRKAELTKAVTDRDTAIQAIPVPPDLTSDLERVAIAVRVFEADAVVQKAQIKSQPVTVNFADKTFSYRLAITRGAHGNNLFAGARSWPLAPEYVALNETCKSLDEKIARLNGNLGVLRDELSEVNARAEEMHAALVSHTLMGDETGKAVLAAMEKATNEAFARLDKKIKDDDQV